MSYNRYASVAGSALRNALKPDQKLKAARRGDMTLKYQNWKEGEALESVRYVPCAARGTTLADWSLVLQAPVAEALAKAAEKKPAA